VRATLIVFPPPSLDELLCLSQCTEPVGIQAPGEEGAVERFHEGVVGRLARSREVDRLVEVNLEMHIAEATELIRIDTISQPRAQTWCDLGCGTGIFTLALATLLLAGSVIHAIDKDEESLAQIPDRYKEVTIHKEVGNLDERNLSLPAIDGVLMANFLHFIEHQGTFVARLWTLSDRLLVVEYDGRAPSQWVPYPSVSPHYENCF
jgi:Methyltransferase domain